MHLKFLKLEIDDKIESLKLDFYYWHVATWNSSLKASSSIEVDLKMEKEKEKRSRREGKEDPNQKKKKKTT